MNRLAKRLVFAQALDVATFCLFFIMVSHSIHTERNPLINAMFALGGWALVGIVKLGYVCIVAHRSTRFQPSTRLIIVISIATASGIAGAGFNLASLISS
jgi:hypothetical protein